jgi:ATP-GRASP peptide maturase of grasp-with-spasm system
MILILSSQDDLSTNDVIDWLRFYNYKFLRISEEDIIEYDDLFLNNNFFDVHLNINNIKYKLSDFKAFWYRRSHYNIYFNKIPFNTILGDKINNHLSSEAQEIHKIVKKTIQNKSINKYDDLFVNKLEVLKKAAEYGFKIPRTLVTNNKSKLTDFYFENKNIVTKNFSPGVFIFDDNLILETFTRIVDETILNSLPNKFSSSLFQENIEKQFELRIFFINNDFYASAIFSQQDDKTKVDFRDYNFIKPNRTPLFELDDNIKNRLIALMKELGLNSGSIDMLVSKENEYIFLEVNPIGQFSQVSSPCNYYLEEGIAKHLIKIADEK